MKKHISGFVAIFCARILSAYDKPYSMVDFKLVHDPVSANIVSNLDEWSEDGTEFGECSTVQDDVACKISFHLTDMSCYFHTNFLGIRIPNSFAWANVQIPKQCYTEVTETIGKNPKRVICTVTPKKWDPAANGGNGSYVTDSSVNSGTQYTFSNGTCSFGL
jgi:hypothetical protein